MLFKVIAFIILSIPMSAFSSGFSGKGKIDYIYQRSGDGHVVIWRLDGVWDNPDGCQNSSLLVIDGTNPLRDSFFSATLSAKMADRGFGAFLAGCTIWNGVTYPTVYGVYNY